MDHDNPTLDRSTAQQPNPVAESPPASAATAGTTPGVMASGCCTSCGSGPSLVYALGQIGFDYGTEARRDSFLQHGISNPHAPAALLAHLEANPSHATAVTWTLVQDTTPIYAILPAGPFAAEGYATLREFLKGQLGDGVERVSVPGWSAGSVALTSGQKVPVIMPELRGMYSWSTTALVKAVAGDSPAEEKVADISNFLERVYHEIRNLGATPQERAINYAATNAFQLESVFTKALETEMKLDGIGVERSPVCRPGADCWDVKLTFFHPKKRLEQAREVYRFTIDVSDVVPVTVGTVRHWHVY